MLLRPSFKFWIPWVIALLIFPLGFAAGRFFRPPKNTVIMRANDSTYQFINPLMGVDYIRKDVFTEYKPLQKALKNYIDHRVSVNLAQTVSVYFRDLNSGHWTGVNEDQTFAPASMLKVVLMMAYLRNAEVDSTMLSHKLLYTGSANANDPEYYKSSHSLEVGKFYTVDELISSMILYSDNNAMNLLNQHIDMKYLTAIYNNLNLPTPDSPSDTDFMSASSYARIFRVLYSSTYFSRYISEKALSLLSHTDFRVGLVAGVPSDTKVSHKFGERTILDPVDFHPLFNELHDCGIVYYAKNPYFLCVMTKGHDFKDLQATIADISKLTYDQVGLVEKNRKS